MYAPECDGDQHNECFDFACPSSHPVRMPEIHLYVRVLGYEVSQVGHGLSDIRLFREELTPSLMAQTFSTVTTILAGMKQSCRESWIIVKMTQRPPTLMLSAVRGSLLGFIDDCFLNLPFLANFYHMTGLSGTDDDDDDDEF